MNVITPSDNAVSVSESIILIVQFDQDVVKDSSGNINVKKYSDDSTFEATAIGSPSVYPPDKGVLPTTLSTLDYSTRDYIFSDNTPIEDVSYATFAGINHKDICDFTTKSNDGMAPPSLISCSTPLEPALTAQTPLPGLSPP